MDVVKSGILFGPGAASVLDTGLFRNTSGNLRVRNAADTAFATLEVADPSTAQQVVSLTFAQSNFKGVADVEPVTLGGTGATTAAGARTNLDAQQQAAALDSFIIGSLLAGGLFFQFNTDQTNWDPGTNWSTGENTIIRFDNNTGASRSAGGLVGVATDRLALLRYVPGAGTDPIVMNHEDAAATATNRFSFDSGANIAMNVGDTLILWYDDTISRWRDVLSTI